MLHAFFVGVAIGAGFTSCLLALVHIVLGAIAMGYWEGVFRGRAEVLHFVLTILLSAVVCAIAITMAVLSSSEWKFGTYILCGFTALVTLIAGVALFVALEKLLGVDSQPQETSR